MVILWRRGFLIAPAAALLICVGRGAEPGAKPKHAFPLVADAGGVVVLPQAAEQPRPGARAVVDVTAGAEPGAANPGLDRAAKVLNLYGAAGLTAGDVKLAVVLHGAAVRAVLSDDSYRASAGRAVNPNLPLIRALRKAGVEVFVCGQALHAAGYTEADVADPVTVADSFLTVVINRQAAGYAYVPGQ